MRFWVSWLLMMTSISACGPRGEGESTTIRVRQNVSVAWGEAGPSREVRLDDPRLIRAMEETAGLVARVVDFRFDVTMMPRPVEPFFENLFERYVGRIPRDLEELARRDPDVFAYGLTHLRAVHFDYDGSIRRPEIRFDSDTGALRIRMSGGELVPRGSMSYGLREAFLRHLRDTYAERSVESLEDADLAHYFRYIREIGDRGSDREARAKTLLDLIALDARLERGASDARLRADVRQRLLRKVEWFRQQRQHHAGDIEALPATSPWHAAEQAFVAFLQRVWPSLGPAERRKVLENVFVRRFNAGREGDPYLRDTFPGLDPFELALDVVDAWVRAGAPAPERSSDETQRLYDYVVCPPRQTGRTRYQRARCDSALYRFASTDPELRPRLFDAVVSRENPALTTALFANLKWLRSPFLLDAWRHVEADAEPWELGARVIGDLMHYTGRDQHAETYDEIARLWRAYPSRRGALLYLLAQLDYPTRSSLVRWPDVARRFGGPATQRDLEAFLAIGDEAVARVPAVIPAIAPGVDIVGTLAPHLGERLGDDQMRRRHHGFPHQVLRHLVEALRERRDTANLNALRAFLERRLREHPSEARSLESLVEMMHR